ncbi:MAG: CpsD/CapB family tyrosine-protein kinase [Candidatus Acidiferrales bacterium]
MMRRETLLTSYSPNGFHHFALKPKLESRIVCQSEVPGFAGEQFRLLAKNLSGQCPEGGVILVTSPTKGDGKTLNVANLALCLAAGAPTLLLEADLRQPGLAQIINYQPQIGVEAAMRGEVKPEAVVGVSDDGIPFHVAAVSKVPSNPDRLLKSAAMDNLIKWARSKFFWVLLDCPPLIPVADVMELLPHSDAVLLVVRVRSTPVELIKKSTQVLGDRLKGVILNEASLCEDSYYHYLTDYYANSRK